MSDPEVFLSSTHRPMHFSVGAVIEKQGEYLLIDRKKFPRGFAGLAGHIEDGESPKRAIEREVYEESGLLVTASALIAEEELTWNVCSKGVRVHYWYLFRCEVTGELRLNNSEALSIGWFSLAQLAQLPLEEVWKYWFEKLKFLESN